MRIVRHAPDMNHLMDGEKHVATFGDAKAKEYAKTNGCTVHNSDGTVFEFKVDGGKRKAK